MNANALVRVENLTRRFGERTVLDALDLSIAPGEFVAMLGRSARTHGHGCWIPEAFREDGTIADW